MREVLLSLVVMLALSVSLSTASATVTADPANLGTLGPVLETKLKEWLVAWRAVQPTLRVEQFKKGETGDMGPTWDSLHIETPTLCLFAGHALGYRSFWRLKDVKAEW